MATTAKNKLEETVVVKLPLDRNNTGDVFVGVNGKTFLIKRGVNVTIPVAVKNVIERSEKMQQIAMEYEQAATEGLNAMEAMT